MSEIRLNDKQLQTLNVLMDDASQYTEIMYGGAARGGKTFLGCLWQILRRLKFPKSAGMICRRDFVDLNATTLRTFREVAQLCGIYELLKFKGGADNLVEFPNGSVIFFRYYRPSPSDPLYAKFGSYDLTDVFNDEAQQITDAFVNVIRGRLSLLTGKNEDGTPWKAAPKMLFTCNPGKGFVHREFWRPFRDGTLPAYRMFVRALPTDNPYLAPEYLEQLMRSDRGTVERLVRGNFDWDDDPDLLFGDIDALEDMFTNTVETDGVEVMAADIALQGRDRFVTLSGRGQLVRLEYMTDFSPSLVVERKIRTIAERRRVARSRIVVDADGVGAFLSGYLTGIKEFHGNEAAADKKYTNIKAQCYYKLAEAVTKREIKFVYIDAYGREVEMPPNIKDQIVEELGVIRIVHRDDGKWGINSKEEQKKILGRSPDIADALMMAMWHRVFKPSGGATFRVNVSR